MTRKVLAFIKKWLAREIQRGNLRLNDAVVFTLHRSDGRREKLTAMVAMVEAGTITLTGEGTLTANAIVIKGYPPSITAHNASVPKWGEIMLLFILPKRDRAVVPSDLAEEFDTVIVPTMGLRRARVWYWKEVMLKMPWWRIIAFYELLKHWLGF
jgi:hypothetical protein